MFTTTMPANLNPVGYQKLTLAAATSLTVPAGAKIAVMRATVNNVVLRDDGTDPTAADGMPIGTGDVNPYIYFGKLDKVRVINAAAGSVLHVLYYGGPV